MRASTLTPLSSSAKPRESTNVSGTMNAAKIVNVIRLSGMGRAAAGRCSSVARPSRPGSRCSGPARSSGPPTRRSAHRRRSPSRRRTARRTTRRRVVTPRSGLWTVACRRCCVRRRRHQGRGGHVSRTAELSSALTAFSALARFASMSPPLRTIAVAASAYALFIFGVQAGLPATA